MRLFFAALTLLVGLQVSAGEIDQPAALSALQAPETLLIDVRTAEEFAAGALPGAARIGHEQIAAQIATLAPEKDTVIVLYCRSGRRSSIAQDSLQALGYRNVINAGGYEQLKAELEAQD
ncbi:sulfurtransferase [Pseudomonas taeanensis MS-3]|jgi:phage shock protein E|uniref:Sulfurtransferase n=1 Tax=Pseudomonas taeanensis MS-3 TaxID=1395571 RepID=A0A0A1YGE2_9PSED|nr:rhodanese-like domain-containing protein [Pseudomonas taeanensis]KFX68068.1 sulfurtransferase [Pseudomonas taeanensis MS-3]MDX1300673.1 rhodanese-like domain-containing protein [Pseudomonas sp.]